MSRRSRAAILGVLTGALGVLLSLLPFGLDLEESLGLHLLFKLRGPRRAPSDVVVVSIDKVSADALNLPGDPAKWPRSVHARLTENLAKAGAAVIAFDVFFGDERSVEDDRLFAGAISRARNVVLSRYLSRETVPLSGQTGLRSARLTLERLEPPFPLLAHAAVASAPFPLPKVPVRVSQYWTFKTGAGGTPTLPVVALQIFALDVYEDFLRLLDQVNPFRAMNVPRDRRALLASGRVEETIGGVRDVVEAEPGTAARMLQALQAGAPSSAYSRRHNVLTALVRMYQSPDSQYLNFYGPARTITTIPYYQVLQRSDDSAADRTPLRLDGKAVFVGTSEYLRQEKRDAFYTVFSEEGGRDISGVEIAATAFANLLEDRPVQPLGLPSHLVLVFVGGVALGVLCTALSPITAAVSVLAAGSLYVIAAQHAFNALAVWYPLAVPLLFQVPSAFLSAVVWRYADTNRERQRIRKVFSYYLPDNVIDQLLANVPGTGPSSQLTYGICLSTDAERYTSLAESLDPTQLASFMNTYYAIVFEPIKRHGGIVSDVIGDAALAIWAAAGPDGTLKAQACSAACDIVSAVDRFNQSSGALQLPTRIGLHSGRMMLGHVGAGDHYEYRAVGDIVNTATRIEGLNKHFGTRMLISEEVTSGLDGFLTRKLGTFLLVGKSKPLVIYELMCRREEASVQQIRASTLFAEALAAYEARSWRQASETFSALVGEYADDQAARFYLRACEQYSVQPPEAAWAGVIRMDKK